MLLLKYLQNIGYMILKHAMYYLHLRKPLSNPKFVYLHLISLEIAELLDKINVDHLLFLSLAHENIFAPDSKQNLTFYNLYLMFYIFT